MAYFKSINPDADEQLSRWLVRASRASHEQLLVRFTHMNSERVSWRRARGNESAVQLDVRQIVKQALYGNHRSLLLAHNHPSGLAQPSQQDLNTTRALERCCHPLGIEIEDHLIVGNDGAVFSFREAGLL